MQGWIQSQMMMHSLSVAEIDHNHIHDPYHLLTSDETLVRYALMCRDSEIAEAWARVKIDNGIRGLLYSPDWSIERLMVGGIPPGTAIAYHAKPLTYCGTLGVIGTPKELSFSINAHSPVAAWEKVRFELETHGFASTKLMLHKLSLGATGFHDLTTRHIKEVESCADTDTFVAWEALSNHHDAVMARLSSSGSMDDPAFPSEIPFLLRNLMVDYGWAEREKQIDYPRLARAVFTAWSMGDSIKSHPPRRHLSEEGFFDQKGKRIEASSEMFSFTSEEKEILKIPPTMRFLVTQNIPLNTALTLREQQAWCNFYFEKNA